MNTEKTIRKKTIFIVGCDNKYHDELSKKISSDEFPKVIFLNENYTPYIEQKLIEEFKTNSEIKTLKEYISKPENIELYTKKAQELQDALNKFKHTEATQIEIFQFTEKNKREPTLTEIKENHVYSWNGWFTITDVTKATTLKYDEGLKLLQVLFVCGVLAKKEVDKETYYRIFVENNEMLDYAKQVISEKEKEITEIEQFIQKIDKNSKEKAFDKLFNDLK